MLVSYCIGMIEEMGTCYTYDTYDAFSMHSFNIVMEFINTKAPFSDNLTQEKK